MKLGNLIRKAVLKVREQGEIPTFYDGIRILKVLTFLRYIYGIIITIKAILFSKQYEGTSLAKNQ